MQKTVRGWIPPYLGSLKLKILAVAISENLTLTTHVNAIQFYCISSVIRVPSLEGTWFDRTCSTIGL